MPLLSMTRCIHVIYICRTLYALFMFLGSYAGCKDRCSRAYFGLMSHDLHIPGASMSSPENANHGKAEYIGFILASKCWGILLGCIGRKHVGCFSESRQQGSICACL